MEIQFTSRELDVMSVLWERGPSTQGNREALFRLAGASSDPLGGGGRDPRRRAPAHA